MAQAIFRALETVKWEDWFQQTQVYLYRGAWQVLNAQHCPALCKAPAELGINLVIPANAAVMHGIDLS